MINFSVYLNRRVFVMMILMMLLEFFIVGNKYTTGVTQPDEDAFTYSIDERAEFVKDFLQELGVSRYFFFHSSLMVV